MKKTDSGLKDKVIGKVKEVEGKVTGDKAREVQGKAQQAKGKIKEKAKFHILFDKIFFYTFFV